VTKSNNKTDWLKKRWLELHQPKQPLPGTLITKGDSKTLDKPGSNLTRETVGERGEKINTQEIQERIKKQIEKIEKQRKEANEKDPILGKQNNTDKIKSLKEPILWFGKIAVGESLVFPGWWEIVPPIGLTVSYYGSTGKNLAIAQAQIMREQYE
jgi:hypothetical protein